VSIAAREIRRLGLCAVVRTDAEATAREAALAAYRGGIRALEITYTTPGARRIIEQLRAQLPDALVGAGTIVRQADAEDALAAGAAFCVSPHSDSALMRWFADRELLYVPGCMTPTELVAAHAAGCAMQKLFPATVFGPAGVKTLLQPLPFLSLMVTGGVDERTIAPFLEGGASVVCVGSNVFTKDRLAAGDWAGIEAHARDLAALVAAARRSERAP
jgi:2-dehydro-3-deoxyphosphogluconate aldolase/(4S)-4-hydroxy-2-oxoglutarate aldolase